MKCYKMNAKELFKYLIKSEENNPVYFATECDIVEKDEDNKEFGISENCSCWFFAQKTYFNKADSCMIVCDYCGGGQAFAISYEPQLSRKENFEFYVNDFEKMLAAHMDEKEFYVEMPDLQTKYSCDWCHEEFEEGELRKTSWGNLCENCISAIRSRGERIVVEY